MSTSLQWLQWAQLGGPALIVLLALSIAALTIAIVKFWEFWETRIWRREFVARAADAWQRRQFDQALAILQRERGPLAQVMEHALAQLRAGYDLEAAREASAHYAQEKLDDARSLLRPLEVIAMLAPLIGLLGTVLGMIRVFRDLEQAGGELAAGALSGGLWEALLTTAAGLAVAIVALAAFHLLDRMVERLQLDMEGALTRIYARPPAVRAHAA
ncbi:MAG TPA: MotA/TolQ/ExbB proton channel family protein [Nevskiaceae bacterium]|nr:MotA/TolQ/ExbB proton channel family protein [Nevskiaceae bacterium]